MKRILSPYIISYVILSIVMFFLYFTHTKLELHMMLCSCHTKLGDFFFRYYTQLAEWPLYVIGLLPLLFKRYWWTIVYAISEFVAELQILILKDIFELPRPVTVFSKTDFKLPEVEGVKLHMCDSFPSGHACAFFVFFTICALLIAVRSYKNGYLKRPNSFWIRTLIITVYLVIQTLAVLGAYSRVYLSQHFFIDVYVGSFIGVVTPCIVVYLFRKKLLY